jgi:hypothetical protein
LQALTSAGTYYILAYANSAPASADYTLTAALLPFTVTKTSISTVGNTGQATIRLDGANFDEFTQVSLIGPDHTLAPVWIDRVGSTILNVTFDFTGATVGDYDLKVISQDDVVLVDLQTGEPTVGTKILGQSLTPGAVHVVAGNPMNKAGARLSLPSAAGRGQRFNIFVEIVNSGLNDVPAPIYLVASNTRTPISFTRRADASGNTQQQIVTVGRIRPTVLAPGERITVPLYTRASTGGVEHFSLRSLQSNDVVNWDDYESFYRARDSRPDVQWNALWDNFKTLIGPTWNSFYTAMRYAAADLASNGGKTFVSGTASLGYLFYQAADGHTDFSHFVSAFDHSPMPARITIPQPIPAPLPPGAVPAPAAPPPIEIDPCTYHPSTANILARLAYVKGIGVPGLYQLFGPATGDLWNLYASSNAADPPTFQEFADGDEVVEGNFLNTGFKKSDTTQFVMNDIADSILSSATNQINSGSLTPDVLPANQDVTFALSGVLSARDLTNAQNFLIYGATFEIPGNIAGGIGGSDRWGSDTRAILGGLVFHRNVNAHGKTTSIDIHTNLQIDVHDTIDFCPGDLGEGLERILTWSLAVLEANDRAYDVGFHVLYTPEQQTRSVSASQLPDSFNPDGPDIQPPAPDGPPDPGSPNPPGLPQPTPDDQGDVSVPFSHDPNDIIGPAGVGAAKFVSAQQPLRYKIEFENDPQLASAPAQSVRITSHLDSHLDPRTFRVGSFGFGDFSFDVPDNQAFYSTRLDLRDSLGIYVDVAAGVDVATSSAFWQFTAIDPATGEAPIDPTKGFLPPNLVSPQGEGFATYTIKPNNSAVTGDVINANATVIFDVNPPIDTPTIFNTLDVVSPTSHVSSLPPTIDPVGQSAQFDLTWFGQDDSGGSGIATYDIFVSEDTGSFVPLLQGTSLTQTPFIGQSGHAYAFYAVATDRVGIQEPPPPAAQAQTFVRELIPPKIASVSVQNGLKERSYVDRFTVTFSEATNIPALIADGSITSAIRLVNLGVNADADADQAITTSAAEFTYDPASNLLSYVRQGPALPDGFYIVTLDSARILDRSGNSLDGNGDGVAGDPGVLQFSVLTGDVTGDGSVDIADQALVDSHIGQRPTDSTWDPNADVDRNSLITTTDRIKVARAVGHAIVLPSSHAPAVVTPPPLEQPPQVPPAAPTPPQDIQSPPPAVLSPSTPPPAPVVIPPALPVISNPVPPIPPDPITPLPPVAPPTSVATPVIPVEEPLPTDPVALSIVQPIAAQPSQFPVPAPAIPPTLPEIAPSAAPILLPLPPDPTPIATPVAPTITDPAPVVVNLPSPASNSTTETPSTPLVSAPDPSAPSKPKVIKPKVIVHKPPHTVHKKPHHPPNAEARSVVHPSTKPRQQKPATKPRASKKPAVKQKSVFSNVLITES